MNAAIRQQEMRTGQRSKTCALELEKFVHWSPNQDSGTGSNKRTKPHETSKGHNPSGMPRDFGLYLRLYSGKSMEYYSMFLASFKYFWFLPVNITVVLDDTPEDREFSKQIAVIFPFPKICFSRKIDPKFYRGRGWLLQQLSMFYADECVDYKYVGFIDTDTFFTTPVTPELLFNGTKPIVIGTFGNTFVPMQRGTRLALGMEEVFKCMTYFPVIMKLKHLVEMRAFITKLHKTDFLSAFKNISSVYVSQFGIMCNYMWYHHRDEYQFHAQITDKDSHTQGQGFHWKEIPSRPPCEYFSNTFTPALMYPKARSSIHFRHHPDYLTVADLIRPGICHSGGFQWCPDVCRTVDRSALHKELFLFEDLDWTWDPRTKEAQDRHYVNVAQFYSSSVKTGILQGCHDISLKAFETLHSYDAKDTKFTRVKRHIVLVWNVWIAWLKQLF